MDLTFCFLHYKSRPICEIKCLFRCSASNGIAHLWPILSQFNCKCNDSQTHLCTMSNKLFWSQQKQGADFWANLSKTDFVLLKLFEVRRDITVLGPKRLECFDSTAWNWYYSIKLKWLQSLSASAKKCTWLNWNLPFTYGRTVRLLLITRHGAKSQISLTSH